MQITAIYFINTDRLLACFNQSQSVCANERNSSVIQHSCILVIFLNKGKAAEYLNAYLILQITVMQLQCIQFSGFKSTRFWL